MGKRILIAALRQVQDDTTWSQHMVMFFPPLIGKVGKADTNTVVSLVARLEEMGRQGA